MFMFYTPGISMGFKIAALARNGLILILKASCIGAFRTLSNIYIGFFCDTS